MVALPRWVLWRYEQRNSKITKVPCNIYGQHIDITREDNHTTYAMAKQHEHIGGIGFVFNGDGIIGIDIDKIIETENELAMYWIERFASYTELSPSGKGYHIYVRGEIPGPLRRKGRWEIYDTKRFFTVTGNQIRDYDTIQSVDLTDFYYTVIDQTAKHRKINRKQEPVRGSGVSWSSTPLGENDVFESLKRESSFMRLFWGDTTGYDSISEAELAFCSYIAKYSQDSLLIDKLYRDSMLYREKWDESRGSQSYGEMTIRKAI